MLRVTSDLDNLNTLRDYVEQYASALGMPPADVYGIVLAVDEAATNICVHGYKEAAGMIEVELEKDERNLIVHLRDRAPLFDPTTVPPSRLSGSLEERLLGGMGLHFMRHYTDELTYQVTAENGNELILKKNFRGEKKQP